MGSTPIPDALLGVWQRQSIQLLGVADVPETPFESAQVYWFQARSRYADLRIPGGSVQPLCGPEAFGGRQRWQPPQLRFLHDLDRNGGIPEDVGELSWDGATLVERGDFELAGRRCSYVERWRQTAPAAAAIEVWERSASDGAVSGLAIRIADQALVLAEQDGALGATRWGLATGGPHLLGSLGGATRPQVFAPAGWRCIEGIASLDAL